MKTFLIYFVVVFVVQKTKANFEKLSVIADKVSSGRLLRFFKRKCGRHFVLCVFHHKELEATMDIVQVQQDFV